MGPSGVLDQSLASITLAISPPPTSQRDTASGVESTCCGLCSPRSMADAPDAVRPSGVIVFPIAPLILQEIFTVLLVPIGPYQARGPVTRKEVVTRGSWARPPFWCESSLRVQQRGDRESQLRMMGSL